ncbi:MAG: bifunctional adenosylcobinamide kinase/adenosylcobinamide-phosphate guanylyltransferase [Cyanobacteriota bacterium]|nr:bifunctional adenosylcobinamide kinase/adenosylcobinamide-phosphate guanylyltransferase [Cyanobacteriota bacterium]
MVVADQPRCTLVTGAASSGKSRWAEVLAQRSGLQVCYFATGPDLPGDSDWNARLQRHRQRRPPYWITREVGGELATALQGCRVGQLALVDSLGTWVAEGLELDSGHWAQRVDVLLAAIGLCPVPLILVGEECGWGVSPPTPIGGLFRQRLGELQQQLMPLCQASWLVVHGRAIDLGSLGVLVPALED